MGSFSILLVLFIVSFVTVVQAGNERLCSIPPVTYAGAKIKYPDAAFALTELENRGIATWYSDREANGDYVETAKQIVSQCQDDTRVMIVVYGLPNKDCEAGASTVGSRVKSASDYEQFIGTLASIIGQRKVLYILEPDAVGLLAKGDGGCAVQSGYLPNLQTAVKTLSTNPNAEIYVDVGYWVLKSSSQTAAVTSIIRQLRTAGRVKGITLNTSNYRSNSELSQLCGIFQNAMGDDMRCIIDTSRNYNGPSSQDEWCNLRSAGIGMPPTGNTGLYNIDYFVWVKPLGDSDAKCDSGRTSDAMIGPEAGEFFIELFRSLWAQGYLVRQEKMPRIGEYTAPPTPPPTPSPTPPPTPPPTSPPPTPVPTTEAPTLTPAPTQSPTPTITPSPIPKATVNNSTSTTPSSFVDVYVVKQAPQQSTPSPIPNPIPTPSPPIPSPIEPGDVETQSSATSKALDSGAIAILTVLALTVIVVVIAWLVRMRRRRLEVLKSPRSSYVSMPWTHRMVSVESMTMSS